MHIRTSCLHIPFHIVDSTDWGSPENQDGSTHAFWDWGRGLWHVASDQCLYIAGAKAEWYAHGPVNQQKVPRYPKWLLRCTFNHSL